MKKVAIITRTKNRGIFLPRLLNSISNQTFKDFIWIIINDGGQRSQIDDIYKKAKDLRIDIKIIHNKKSNGIETASNQGIKNSNSKYIVIHDDDDTWEKDFLKETVEFLESEEGKNYGGVITHSFKVIEKINYNSYKIISKSIYDKSLNKIFLSDIAKINRFPPISFLFRREIYNKLIGFDESLQVLGDWDFNLRFLLLSDIGVIRKPLANYHLRTKDIKKEDYMNTVIHKLHLHDKYEAIIRNKYLREDIKNNCIGLGFLMNINFPKEDNSLVHKIIMILKKIIK
jgi:glycosyltransferase involved in cell wall biosynthesis